MRDRVCTSCLLHHVLDLGLPFAPLFLISLAICPLDYLIYHHPATTSIVQCSAYASQKNSQKVRKFQTQIISHWSTIILNTFTLYGQQGSDLIKALNCTITIFGDSSGINILSTILSRHSLSALSLNALLSSLDSFQSPELLAYKWLVPTQFHLQCSS